MTLSEVFAYIVSWQSVSEKKLTDEFGSDAVNLLHHLVALKLIFPLFRGDMSSVVYREVKSERW